MISWTRALKMFPMNVTPHPAPVNLHISATSLPLTEDLGQFY